MFLYNNSISKISDCPCNKYNEISILGCFRWVYSDIMDVRNFQPPAIKSKRANHFIHNQDCAHFATSFHTNLKDSITHYNQLSSHLGKEKAKSYLGTHIAKGNILKTDGKSKIPDIHSHFDIHLYKGHNINNTSFKIVQEI